MTSRFWFVVAALGATVASTSGTDPEGPTWSRDVRPIFEKNCVECHRPNQVAPFPLTSYRDAAKRAKFIAKIVSSRLMPPWSPDGPVGAFQGERRLSDAQIASIGAWAASGAPEGDAAGSVPIDAPPPGVWLLGKPDAIVRMPRPYAIAAGPGDRYRVFPIPFSLAGLPPETLSGARIPGTDLLAVAAVEIHPSNWRVLHHADVWVDESGIARKREASEGEVGYASFGTPGFPASIYLGGRVPGTVPRFLPEGIAAATMPVSGDIALQSHYTVTGKPEADQTEIGLYLMKKPTQRVVEALFLRSFNLELPAGAGAYTVRDELEIPADCGLLSVFAHMHFLGKEVHAQAVFPDGRIQPLLDISRWSFIHQDRYYYREPFVLPKGTKIQCRWVFDNSARNPSNPFSPPRPVQFGPNATDEMCEFHLGVVPINLADYPLFPALREAKMKDKIQELSPRQRARFHWEEAFER